MTPSRAVDERAHAETGIGALWRLGHGSEGWGWTYGFGWYTLDLDESIGAGAEGFGQLRVRPFLAGYGYSRVFGRARVSGNLLGGFALNSFNLRPAFADAYRQRLGAQSVDLGYTIARPSVTIKSALGNTSDASAPT